jgi:hypothetical protein
LIVQAYPKLEAVPVERCPFCGGETEYRIQSGATFCVPDCGGWKPADEPWQQEMALEDPRLDNDPEALRMRAAYAAALEQSGGDVWGAWEILGIVKPTPRPKIEG